MTLNEWDLFWVTWMLFFCVANGAAVLSCVVFTLAHYHENGNDNDNDNCNDGEPSVQDSTNISDTKTKTNTADQLQQRASSVVRSSEKTAQSMALLFEDVPTVCGKRKERNETFGVTSAMSQGKWKQQKRRILTVTQGSFSLRTKTHTSSSGNHFSKTRAFSFGDASTFLRHAEPSVPLRRVVSCGDVKGIDLYQQKQRVPFPQHYQTKLEEAWQQQQQSTVPKADQRPSTLLNNWETHVRTFVVEKLQQAARDAVDEVLTSVFSFLTYAMLLFVVRQYSAVAIGVSLDLGAFSIEL